MLPGRRYTPGDLWQIALRHKWLILIPWVLVAAGVVGFSRTLEDRYVSESLLQIMAPAVPQNLARATITTSIEERLPIITAQIMTRARLEKLVQEFDLYAEERRSGQLMEDIIGRMRERDINVAAVKGDAFRVSFESNNARQALRVTEKLATFFVDENLRDRELQASTTTQFLDTQLDEARRRLFESEKKVEEFRRAHAGELPSQLSTNMAQQQSLENRLAQNQEQLQRDRDQRREIDREIAEAEAELQVAQQTAAVVADTPAGPTEQPLAQQLERARAQYAAMALKFTADYPDMKAAARVIAELEARAEKEALSAPLSGASRPRNPAEARLTKRLQELKLQLSSVDSQIAQREAAARALQGQIAVMMRRIEATPTRESEMIAITRDYETLQQIYTSTFQKSEDAKVAANLERRQIGETFKIIDPARLPERPASPDRLQFYLGGVFGGLFVGLGLVGLLEYKDSSFRSDTDVVTVLALPVLATIPAIVTKADRIARRRRWRYQVAAAVLVGAVLAGGFAWYTGTLQRLI